MPNDVIPQHIASTRRPILRAAMRCDGHAYRPIDPSRARMWQNILVSKIILQLHEQGLIADTTFIANESGPALRQEAVPIESCPHEWCPAMLRDAARTLLNVAIQLARRGYALNRIDATTVQFHGPHPIVADLSSIAPLADESTWLGYTEFAARFLYPLAMMSHGHDANARRHLASGGVGGEMLRDHVPFHAIPASLRVQWRAQSKLARITRPVRHWARRKRNAPANSDDHRANAVVRKLLWAREELEEIAAHLPPAIHNQPPVDDPRLSNILASLRPHRILQQGGQITATNVDSIIVDPTPARTACSYAMAVKQNLPLLPLMIDLAQPLPQSGRPAIDRLRGDMLIARASNGLLSPLPSTIEANLQWLMPWTKRWLILQIPYEWPSTPAGLVGAMQCRFTSVINLAPSDRHGPLLLCEA